MSDSINNGGGTNFDPSLGQASMVMDKIVGKSLDIQNIIAEIQAVIAEVKAKKDEINSFLQTKPTNKDADDYGEKLASFNEKLTDLFSEMNKINVDLAKAQKSLEDATKEQARLQQTELPAAEKRDAANAQKELDNAKKAMEAMAADVNSEEGGLDSLHSNTMVLRAERKKIDNGDPKFQLAIKMLAANQDKLESAVLGLAHAPAQGLMAPGEPKDPENPSIAVDAAGVKADV